jgi:hypothetical protein
METPKKDLCWLDLDCVIQCYGNIASNACLLYGKEAWNQSTNSWTTITTSKVLRETYGERFLSRSRMHVFIESFSFVVITSVEKKCDLENQRT